MFVEYIYGFKKKLCRFTVYVYVYVIFKLDLRITTVLKLGSCRISCEINVFDVLLTCRKCFKNYYLFTFQKFEIVDLSSFFFAFNVNGLGFVCPAYHNVAKCCAFMILIIMS